MRDLVMTAATSAQSSGTHSHLLLNLLAPTTCKIMNGQNQGKTFFLPSIYYFYFYVSVVSRNLFNWVTSNSYKWNKSKSKDVFYCSPNRRKSEQIFFVGRYLYNIIISYILGNSEVGIYTLFLSFFYLSDSSSQDIDTLKWLNEHIVWN